MSLELTRRAFGKAALAVPVLAQALPAEAAANASGSQVHRFEQTRPFPVNAYIVEGEAGVVIVDGTLTVSASSELRRRADAIGKPIVAVLLTHPHPDHYAGLAAVTAGLDIPIVAQAGVDDVVRRDDALKNSIVGPMFGHEWPQRRVFPIHRIGDGEKPILAPALLSGRSTSGRRSRITTACSFSTAVVRRHSSATSPTISCTPTWQTATTTHGGRRWRG